MIKITIESNACIIDSNDYITFYNLHFLVKINENSYESSINLIKQKYKILTTPDSTPVFLYQILC